MRNAWLILIFAALAPLAAQQPDILYYKFDESSGALARNSAVPGQGYSNGVLSGPPVWNTTDPMIPPSCLDNDGQDRLMSTGYSMDERNGKPFTIEFWFRTTGGGYQDFCNDSDSFALWLAGGQLQAWLGRRNNGQIPQLNGGTGLNDGQWHYAALTYNGNNSFNLYWGDTTGGLNSASDNENTTFTNRAFELLYWQAAVPATYDGEMDEFRLWSVERSAAELQANRFNSLATQDLEVVDPNGVFVQHQGSTTFTGVAGGTYTDYTFTVYNTRTSGDVNFTPVTLPSITGATASVISNPTTVSPGGNTTFTIRVTPLQSQFSVDINLNNDRTPNPYQLTLNGWVDTGRPEILYYRLNEGSGTLAYNDATPGQGNNPATFSAGPNWITTGQPLGAAAAGGTASLDTGFSCANLPSPEFTLEFWVRRSGNGTNTICGDGSSFRVYRQNQNLRIAAGIQGGSQDIDTTVNLPNNTWTHIAIVSDPGNYGLRVYQDGVLEFEEVNFSFPFENQLLTVFSNGGNNNLNGDLDEFRLWAHARSQAEIAAEMNTELIGDLEVVRGATIPHTGSDPLGNVTLGSSATLDYVLNNIGSAELLLGNPCVSYSANVNCTVNVTVDPAGALVSPAGNANAQVQVSPVGVGPFAVQLEFASNDPDTPIYIVNVTGTGLGVPAIQVERPAGNVIPHTGGDPVAGTVAGAQTSITYTIRNPGTMALDLTGWAAVSQSNCTVTVNNPSAATVGVGLTETMQVDITPGVKGAWSFTLEIDSTDPSTPTYQVNVSGTAASGGEIDVQRPASNSIADGGGDSYTPSYTGVPYSLVYTIENLSTATGELLLDTPTTVTANSVTNCSLIITQPLTTSLLAGDTTTFQVDVTPGAGSPVSFQLVIGSDDVDEASYEINFSTPNNAPPNLSVNTGPVGYGAWNLGVTSSPATLHTITNNGGGPLTISSIANLGANPGDWVFTPAAPLPVVIPVSGTFDISGVFTPSALGARAAILRITSDSGGLPGAITDVAVEGTGTQAQVDASPASHSFGDVNEGVAVSTLIDFTNNGGGDAWIDSVSIIGPDAADFAILNGPFGNSLASSASLNVQVQFTAALPQGVRNATLRVVWGQSSTVGLTQTDVPLDANVTQALVGATPGSGNFGSTNIGTTGTAIPFTIENTGSGNANIAAIGLVGAGAAEWTLSGVPVLPYTLAPGAANAITVTATFQPANPGNWTPTLVITWEQAPGIGTTDINIPFSGTATQADVTVSPVSHAFGTFNIGVSSSAQTFTFTNIGDGSAWIDNIALGGVDAADFQITTAPAPGFTQLTGAPNAFTVDVVFSPQTTGAGKSATLVVTWEQAPGILTSSAIATLSGDATGANVTASPTSHTYATRNINTISPAFDFDFTNTGTGAAEIISVVLGGADAGEFFVSNTTAINSPFAVSDSFTVSIEYRPTFAATHNATLTVTWEQSPSSPQSTTVVNLSGDATAANVTASPTSHTYATRNINTISPAVDFDFTNTGTGDADIISVALGGANPGEFFISNTTAINAPFAVSDNFTVSVEYRPTFEASHTATLIVTWEQNPGSPQSTTVVNLSGDATAADVTASPTSHTYATRNVNTVSPAFDFDFTNTGTGAADIISVALGGANPGEFFISNTTAINAPFAVSDSFTVSVEYRPTFEASHTATLIVTWEQSPGSPQSTTVVNLSGDATAADVTASPTSHIYATRNVNTISPAFDFDFTNTGTGAAEIISVVLGGADSGEFFVSNTTAINAPFAVSDSFTVSVEYRPTFVATHNATLTVTWEQSPGSPQSTTVVNLDGTATAADVTASPTSHTYPTRNINTVSPAFDFDFTNTGNGSADVVSVVLGGADAGEFFISNTTSINSPFAVSDSFTVSVEYRPTFEASHNATLTVTWEQSPGSPQSTTVVSLSGTSTAADVTASPSSHAYATRNINTISPAVDFDFTNTGTGSADVISVVLGGADAGQFFISNTTTINAPFAVSDSFTVSVEYRPTLEASHTATLTVTWEQSPGSPQSTTVVNLSGTATAANVTASPTSHTFATRNINTVSTAVDFDFTNTGSGSADVSSVALGGANPGEFFISNTTTINAPFAVSDSFTVSVEYRPTFEASHTATLVVTWEQSPGSPQSTTVVNLSGDATAADVTASPTSHTYATRNINTVSPDQTFTFTNTGTGAGLITSVGLGGTNPGEFSISSVSPYNTPFAVSDSFTVDVAFSPVTAGSHSAQLVVSWEQNPGSPAQTTIVNLSGDSTQAVLGINPTSETYLDRNVNTQSPAKTFTVSNSGTGDAEIVDIRLAGSGAADYVILAPGSTSFTLLAGNNFDVDVAFAPLTTGTRNATLEIEWQQSPGSASSITSATLSAFATQGVITTTPSPFYDYGTVNVGGAINFVHQIDNPGDGPATIRSVSAVGGDATMWSFSGLTFPFVVAASGNTNFTGSFSPTSTGLKTTTLRIVYDQGTGPTTNVDVTLEGTGVASAVSTPNVVYPSVNQYVTSAPVTHTITNSGAGTAEITQIAFSGLHAGDWAFVAPAPATPLLIGPGGSFQFDATWTPQGPNLRQATLEVYWRNAGSPSAPTLTTATVSGTATYGDIQSTPQSVDYGNVQVGQSAQIAHNIDNLGNGNAQILSVTLVNSPSDWTLINAPSSPVTILPSQTLVVFGRFEPTSTGPQTEQIRIEWTHTAGPVQTFIIDLQGNGVPPSSITNVNVGPDTGGPVSVSATVNGPVGAFIDVTVEYATGANPGPNACVLASHPTYTISGNQILSVPANTTIQFYWDAYATEGHVTHNDYVLTLTPELSGTPGTPGSSAPFTLDRQGGWAQHVVPFEDSPGIFSHTAVFDAANNRMVVFGGKRLVFSNEVWIYETNQYGSGWRQIFPSGPQPSPRGQAVSVYDATHNRMVIFGGRYNNAWLNDTWALDLTPGAEAWTQLATVGSQPPGRDLASMVMDDANDRALLFGGRYGGLYYSDVWELDLSSPGTASWNGPLATSGTTPSGRWGHAAAFDPVNNRMVVFGGRTSSGEVDEVHQLSFSGTPTWSAVSTGGTPGARYLMTAGYDSVNNALMLVSGYQGSSKATDTWYLPLSGPSADTWSQLADDPQSAGGRVYGTAVCDAAGNQMLVYGGLSSVAISSISFLELSGTPSWDASATSSNPDGRYGAAMAYDNANDRLVVWGGRSGNTFPSGTWALDRTTPTGTWSTVNTVGTEPTARYWMAHAYDPVGNRLFIHGGRPSSGGFADDLWELDLDTDTWTQLSVGGAGARERHAMVYDPVGDRLILFGGYNGAFLNDAWQYQIGIGWSAITVPVGVRARLGHSATMDTGGGRYRALFFHGHIQTAVATDIWELDLTGMTWTNVTPVTTPPGRYAAAYASNATGDRVWINGGYGKGVNLDDTWELDLTGGAPVWTQHVLSSQPISRAYHNAALDPSGTLYLGFGLTSNRAVSDLWTLDTSSPASGYSMVNAPTLPPAMVHANVALDEANNRLIAFSGIVDGVHSTGLWQLDLSSPIATWSALNAGGTAPSPRRSASMVYDDSGAYPRMIMYGGRQDAAQSSVTDEVWELDLSNGSEQWSLLATTIVNDPGPRTQHTAIIDDAANRMVVFGGSDDTGAVLNSVFELDLTTLTWTEITRSGTWPVARFAHSAIYDAPRQRMLVFGGYDGGSALGDVMSFDLTTDLWSVVTPSGTAPSARYYHTLVVDPVNQRMLCYGGVNLSTPYADFFEYDLVNDAWSTITPPVARPAARWAYGAVWDGARSRMVMVGGYLAGQVESQDQGDTADTWFWGD